MIDGTSHIGSVRPVRTSPGLTALTRMPRAQLEGSDLREHREPGLGAAVRAHAGGRLHGVEARGEDDRPAAGHPPRRVLDGQQRAQQVDLDDPHPVRGVGVGNRPDRAGAHVGERDMQPAEPVLGRGHERFDVALGASHRSPATSPPRSASAAAKRSAPISPIMTLAPSVENRRTAASPIPDAPPVTTATFPARRPPEVIPATYQRPPGGPIE
jgi:hypothetical protein